MSNTYQFHHCKQGIIEIIVDEPTKTLTVVKGKLDKQELLDLIHESFLLAFANQVFVHFQQSKYCVSPDIADVVEYLSAGDMDAGEHKLLNIYHRFDDYRFLQQL